MILAYKSVFTSLLNENPRPQAQEVMNTKVTKPLIENPLPENEIPVGDEWFDDAIFIGDSLTVGLSAYNILDDNKVIASTGINPQTILNKACIKSENGTLTTVLEATKNLTPQKIYVMLGSNGIAFIDEDKFIELYSEFIDDLKVSHPESDIYIQSILPVTKQKENSDKRYSNSKIDKYNDALLKLAKDKEVYYLNVSEAIKDETGCLPATTGSDGIHFGPSIYNTWLDYLKKHYK